MSDALEGPNSLINYWGLSYGTAIGAYLVNMFPNRVGRIILDGVMSPVAYSAQPPHLVNYVLSMIDAVYQYSRLGYPYTSEYIRSIVFSYMYEPLAWAELADVFRQLEASLVEFETFIRAQGGGVKRSVFKTDFVPHLPTAMNPVLYSNLPFLTKIKDKTRQAPLTKRQEDSGVETWGYYAVTCGDAIDPGTITTKDVLDEIVKVAQNQSPLFGPTFGVGGFFCHRWGSRAVERYSGPWNTQLANPILVIGNTADPITSLVNARFISDQLGISATLITHEAFGHTSLAMPSTCVISAIANYLLSGQVDTFLTNDANYRLIKHELLAPCNRHYLSNRDAAVLESNCPD
ncbi:hypothetical protein FRC03_011092 [Tulasnella sp. 419]|nr:hypothetical protein FRC03_011092 [Tulasnella sp. 419]